MAVEMNNNNAKVLNATTTDSKKARGPSPHQHRPLRRGNGKFNKRMKIDAPPPSPEEEESSDDEEEDAYSKARETNNKRRKIGGKKLNWQGGISILGVGSKQQQSSLSFINTWQSKCLELDLLTWISKLSFKQFESRDLIVELEGEECEFV